MSLTHFAGCEPQFGTSPVILAKLPRRDEPNLNWRPNQLGWAAPIYVAVTDERVNTEAKAGIESLLNRCLHNQWEMLPPPGYTSLVSTNNTMRPRISLATRGRNQTIDELMESGTVVAGSPRAVRTRIERMREAMGLNIVVAMLQFGVLTNELTKRNAELSASEVTPHLRG